MKTITILLAIFAIMFSNQTFGQYFTIAENSKDWSKETSTPDNISHHAYFAAVKAETGPRRMNRISLKPYIYGDIQCNNDILHNSIMIGGEVINKYFKIGGETGMGWEYATWSKNKGSFSLIGVTANFYWKGFQSYLHYQTEMGGNRNNYDLNLEKWICPFFKIGIVSKKYFGAGSKIDLVIPCTMENSKRTGHLDLSLISYWGNQTNSPNILLAVSLHPFEKVWGEMPKKHHKNHNHDSKAKKHRTDNDKLLLQHNCNSTITVNR